MRPIAICCLAGMALIAGCAKHETSQAGGQTPATASLPSVLGRPHPKPGLWRTTISTNAGPGVSMTGEICLDASNEDLALNGGRSKPKDCDPVHYEPAVDGYGFNIVCHIGKRTVTTDGRASGDFKTAYAVTLSTRMEPAPAGLPSQVHSTIKANWEGPCPRGAKPGAMSMKLSGFGPG